MAVSRQKTNQKQRKDLVKKISAPKRKKLPKKKRGQKRTVVKAEHPRGLRRSTRRYIRNVTLNQARLRYAVVRRSCVGRASISAR
jgi:hypothetical protein